MTFELSTNASSATPFPAPEEIDVRFLFRNGTASNAGELVAYPLFGQEEVFLPWKAFVAGMNGFAVGNQAQWCGACGNSTGTCSPTVVPGMNGSSSSSSSGSSSSESTGAASSSGGMSKAVAGVIGAMVTLAVVLGVEALVMVVGGWRLVGRKRVGVVGEGSVGGKA